MDIKYLVFDLEEEKVNEKIEFISAFRNVKAENGISKEAKVLINDKDEIIIKMLKLNECLVDEKQNINSLVYEDLEVKITPERRQFFDELIIGKKMVKLNKSTQITNIIITILEIYIYIAVFLIVIKLLDKYVINIY